MGLFLLSVMVENQPFYQNCISFRYDNYIALSKFAEYLDSTSGALKNSDYRMHRAQMIMEQQQQRDKSSIKPKAKEYPELDI